MTGACRFESAVLEASREDRWTDELRRHAAQCGDCAAALAVAPWMSRFARISDREHILPDPSVVWLKARLFQGTVEANRASRPLDVMQMLAYLVVAGGWAGVLTWRWDTIASWLHGLTPSGFVQTAAGSQSLSISFFALVLALGSMTVMLALHTIMTEE